jgi:hypothetical protein
MKRITTIIFGLLLTTSLTANAAYAQNPSSTSPQNPPQNSTKPDTDVTTKTPRMVLKDANGKPIGDVFTDAEGQLILIKKPGLIDGLNTVELNLNLLVVVLLTILCGGIGGVVFELLNLQGNIEKPHKPSEDELAAKLAYANLENVIDLGVWARILIGAAAAPPAMLFLRPETAFGLLAMSVVAGSAGTAVFRSLQERLLLAVAQKDKEEAETHARKQTLKLNAQAITPKLEEALKAVEELERFMRKNSESLEDLFKLKFNEKVSLDPKCFCNVWTPLNEAKGIEPKTVEPSINAFKALADEVYKHSKSEKDQQEITIQAGATIDLKNFIEVKKLLNEAKGAIEAIENSPTPLPAPGLPPSTGNGNISQPESNKEQNGVLKGHSLVN